MSMPENLYGYHVHIYFDDTNKAREIASGAVRPVLTDYEPARLSISAVRPGRRFLASKVRVFIDFLAEIFAQDPSLAL